MRRAALAFIFVTVLIDVLAFGLIIPVLPHLVEDLAGGDTRDAAFWVGVFSTTFALIQFVSSPIQGALSDRFGRRPVILASCLGLGADFALMALAPNLWILLVGRVLSAITSASFTTANAYVADVVAPDERAKAFGLLGAAFGLGFVVGPALGGWLGGIDLRLPFWFAGALATVNFAYGLFVLPESLPKEKRLARFDASLANPLAALVVIRRHPAIWGLAAIIFLYDLAHYVYPSVFVLFADYRFDWGPREVGGVMAAVGVASIVVQAWLVGRVVQAVGERRTILIGSLFGATGFAIYGLASTPFAFLLGVPVMAVWGVSSPATQAIITRHVAPEEQGRMQGALASLASLTGILGPGLYTSIFRASIGEEALLPTPGMPFLVASILIAATLVVAWRYARVAPAA
ncbi:MAG: TCR/Tet family MFS transporter [Sandaracinaceae bacterium]|nr:TCR/Tet family MFS transporter [Sandaracinaceae bacterium]